jgi:hypothetical protein
MKKLQGVQVDDSSKLDILKDKYDDITANTINQMQLQYTAYLVNGGNPWSTMAVGLGNSERDELKKAYKSKAAAFSYITEIRNSSPNVCPMCGSQSTSDVDHYLPQQDYPALAVFSKNLIPACKCNRIKGKKTRGDIQPKRLIHPLFDDFANQRLFKIEFSGQVHQPDMKIVLCQPNHPAREILIFHRDMLLDHDHTWVWVFGEWGNLVRMPKAMLKMLFETGGDVDLRGFTAALTRYESSITSSRGTPNNWKSMLLYGLLSNPRQLEWLNNRYNNSTE